MSTLVAPTLEDLRHASAAAWLWDGARGRIVWANAAGIAYFGGTSLFDLVDRPFDYAEPGVERVMALAHSLSRGQTESGLLHFPSSGHTVPLECQCSIHALGDGRAGVLVVASRTSTEITEIPATKMAEAFDLLPVAAAFVSQDGTLHGHNAAATMLFTTGQRASIRSLYEDPAVAEELLARLEAAATISEIRSLRTKIGPREFRLTLRRLGDPPDQALYAMLLMDDVTERRALEKSLHEGTPDRDLGMPAANAAEAFRQLGKVLTESVAAPQAAPSPAPRPAAAKPAKPRRVPPVLPQVVMNAVNTIKDPVIITKSNELVYANPKAQKFFGHDSFEGLMNDDAVWNVFAPLQNPLAPTTLSTGENRPLQFTAQMSTVAWQGGPARQFTLREVPQVQVSPVVQATPVVQAAPMVQATPAPVAPVEPQPQEVAAPVPEAPALVAPVPVAQVAESEPPPPAPPPPPEKPAIIQLVEEKKAVADDELRAILDTATDGIITLDKSGKIHTFSAGAEAIFGYRIAEVADKPFIDLLAPDSRKTLRDYLSALQGPGLASVFNDGREVDAIVKQGGTVPLFLTIGALQSTSSRSAFCAVVRDITQWKRTEAELREAKEVAEATSRQKSEFLARISHELRTPLNAIMGFSEVMRLERFGEMPNEKYKGYVNDIHSSGGLLLSLINDLLDLSKVEAGQLELNFTAVNLSETADNAIKMLQEAATGARVVLRKAMPTDLPNVVADQRSMRQIMLNIISNAIKFTDPGGQVIISAVMSPAGELKFRVKDTGIGMNETQLRDALEPFKRIVTSGREVQGTGLGLPLTKALAEANRTSFAITSEPRKGTLIELTFPTTRVLAE